MQEILRRHPDRGTLASFTSWKPYTQSYRFFSVRGFRQPLIGSHYLRNTNKNSICHTFIRFRRCTKIPKTPINCGFLEVFDQASIHITHKISYPYLAKSSEVRQNSLLKKWGQSDVDPHEFKIIIRTSSISKFQPYHKHQVL